MTTSALDQLRAINTSVDEIHDILALRMPNQRRLAAANVAAKTWLAKSVWKEDDSRRSAGVQQARLGVKQFCRRVLEQAEALTKLLFDLDLILSGGDATIRQERKTVVGKIQELLLTADAMAIESDSLTRWSEVALAEAVESKTMMRSDSSSSSANEMRDDEGTETSSTIDDDFEFVDLDDDMLESTSTKDTAETPAVAYEEGVLLHYAQATLAQAPHADETLEDKATEKDSHDEDGVPTDAFEHVSMDDDDTTTVDGMATTRHDDEALNEIVEAPAEDGVLHGGNDAAKDALPHAAVVETTAEDKKAPAAPHTIHVHVNGRTYTTHVQGTTTHIYIDGNESILPTTDRALRRPTTYSGYDVVRPTPAPHMLRLQPRRVFSPSRYLW
ncbi:Aste57867_16393 [Aphanomyces stellatus]|uniref:Aste57867_16393 protein n=1 Tax=Aphanomyces stellatus TaxID=120398 RepID=A0A485L5C2_9STRA|nr:hypothetical protein As57867_016336 [Aphanomyces stellatus]VFT93169.1 Aste57867_16393 [Aphanomyces stellatus]